MKKPSDKLFRLIRSLTKAEIKYFRAYARGQEDDASYLKLFNVLLAQKKFDEPALQKKLGMTADASGLAAAKVYLYNKILESLSAVYMKQNLSYQLCHYMIWVGILQAKGLSDQALSLTRKAKTLAMQSDRSWYITFFTGFELNLIHSFKLPRQEISDIPRLLETYNLAAESAIRGMNIFQASFDNFYVDPLEKNNIPEQSEESLAKIKVMEAAHNEALETIQKNGHELSLFREQRALFGYYQTHYLKTGDRKKAAVYGKKQLELYQLYPEFIKVEPISYTLSIQNFIFLHVITGDIEAARDALKQYVHIEKHYPFIHELSTVSFFKSNLFIHSFGNEPAAGAALIGEKQDLVQLLLERMATNSDPESLQVLILVAAVYFLNADHAKAHDILSRIIDLKREKTNYLELAKAQILYLLVNFELKNESLLEYKIPSVIKFLQYNKEYPEGVRILLRELKQRSEHGLEKIPVTFYASLSEAIGPHDEDFRKYSCMPFFDLPAWIARKAAPGK